MNTSAWARVVLCGLLVGVTFTALTAVLVTTLGSEFMAIAGAHAADGSGATKTGPALYLVTLSAGIWAMWLYAVVRPRLANRLAAIATVSLAWWTISTIQSLKWVLLLGIPLDVALPLSANLFATVIAVVIGSFVFERNGRTDT